MLLKDLPIHHAILMVSPERQVPKEKLWGELSLLSPAHKLFDQTVLDIDTARNIISWAQTPYNEEKIGLITFATATIPAQNAMLKVLEEPRAGVRFILLTTNKRNLIDTVLSRVNYIEEASENKEDPRAVLFLKTPHAMRMKLPEVVELLARIDEEGRKDREAVRTFILSLVGVLSHKKADPRYIGETLESASYASDASASGKALIEYLALFLPQTQ